VDADGDFCRVDDVDFRVDGDFCRVDDVDFRVDGDLRVDGDFRGAKRCFTVLATVAAVFCLLYSLLSPNFCLLVSRGFSISRPLYK
jgi:hypothetical protein